jgi:membrane-associated protein
MQALHDFITTSLFTLSPLVRDVVIFLFSYAEGLPVIGSILPGGTVAIILGSLTTEGFISPLVAINLVAIGGFLGDMTGFVFGKQLRKIPYVQRMIAHEKHQKNWDIFDRHIALVIIFGKLIPVIRSTPSLFAGARNIPKLKYTILVIIGSYLWAIVGIYGGNILGKVLGANAIPLIIIVVVGLAVMTWIGNRLRKGYKRRKAERLLK